MQFYCVGGLVFIGLTMTDIIQQSHGYYHTPKPVINID